MNRFELQGPFEIYEQGQYEHPAIRIMGGSHKARTEYAQKICALLNSGHMSDRAEILGPIGEGLRAGRATVLKGPDDNNETLINRRIEESERRLKDYINQVLSQGISDKNTTLDEGKPGTGALCGENTPKCDNEIKFLGDLREMQLQVLEAHRMAYERLSK